ncbi:putative ribonuclease H protein, partial [Trifolium medium]|nr:putative ribonuclease H protein [Trifolium medium]
MHDDIWSRPRYPWLQVQTNVANYKVAMKVGSVSNNTKKLEVLVRWNPPPEGWIRLNTEGSCKENKMAGCGGVVRGSNGEGSGL